MKVIILRGISGCGKNTWIEQNHPNAIVCSADDFFMENGVYKFDPNKLGEAHRRCLNKFICSIIEGNVFGNRTIAVNNTNCAALEFMTYARVAQAFNCEVEVVRFECDAEVAAKRNSHGVPLYSIQNMDKKLKGNPTPKEFKETVVGTNPKETNETCNSSVY